MLRNAIEADIPRIFEIRNSVRENKLRDPSKVTTDDVRWFIKNPGIFVWEEEGRVVGFSAADPRDGSMWALFMDEAYEGRCIAQKLFQKACDILISSGCKKMWLTTAPGSRAEKFYLAAGWKITGFKDEQLVFEKQL
jgi:ribosomal protein S18 acetylase RimI-like enzyme